MRKSKTPFIRPALATASHPQMSPEDDEDSQVAATINAIVDLFRPGTSRSGFGGTTPTTPIPKPKPRQLTALLPPSARPSTSNVTARPSKQPMVVPAGASSVKKPTVTVVDINSPEVLEFFSAGTEDKPIEVHSGESEDDEEENPPTSRDDHQQPMEQVIDPAAEAAAKKAEQNARIQRILPHNTFLNADNVACDDCDDCRAWKEGREIDEEREEVSWLDKMYLPRFVLIRKRKGKRGGRGKRR